MILVYHMDYLAWVPMELLPLHEFLNLYMTFETTREIYGANMSTCDSGRWNQRSQKSVFWGMWPGKSMSHIGVNLEGK